MTQEMNLEDGSMAHFLVLRLPSGVSIKALVSDESAQAVIYAKVNGGAPPHPATPSPVPSPLIAEREAPLNEDGDALIFGGEDVPLATVEPPPAPLPPRNRITRVEKDEWGYPILRVRGGQDPGEVVGGMDPDEDGVSQG